MLRSVDWMLPTFRDNLSVSRSRIQQSKKMGLIDCSETSLTTSQHFVTYQKSEELKIAVYPEISM
jgi:hypothetical protein